MTPEALLAGGHALIARATDARVWAAAAELDGHPERAQSWRLMRQGDLRSAIILLRGAATVGAEECRRVGLPKNVWQFAATLADDYQEDLNDG